MNTQELKLAIRIADSDAKNAKDMYEDAADYYHMRKMEYEAACEKLDKLMEME